MLTRQFRDTREVNQSIEGTLSIKGYESSPPLQTLPGSTSDRTTITITSRSGGFNFHIFWSC